MKITKILSITLSLLLMLSAMAACTAEGDTHETVKPTAGNNSAGNNGSSVGNSGNSGANNTNTGACDMAAIAAEIDSMRVGDFAETASVSEYVKFTVKDHGEFVIRLRADIAPITVENFQGLVSDGFYDGLTFHRVMKGFMIQGGDPNGDGTGGSGTSIKGEYAVNGVRNDLSHIAGVISMARRGDPYYDSATSQFFICNADASGSLDRKYAGFGYVVAGLEVVLMVSDVEVKYNAYGTERSVPVEPVVIEKVCFVEKQ